MGTSMEGRENQKQGEATMANQHLEVLNALDVAKIQWYHFTTIVIAGMGFFTDAYDLFCISMVTKLLGRIYYHENGSPTPGTLPPNVSSAVNGVAFCGTLTGQLFFGWLGDKLGRSKVYCVTLSLMIVCALGSGPPLAKHQQALWPRSVSSASGSASASAAITLSPPPSCRSTPTRRPGAPSSPPFSRCRDRYPRRRIVTIIVTTAFNNRFDAPPYDIDPVGSTVPQADYVWRIILMFGAVPAAMTFYWRMKMPETARYTALVAQNAERAAQDMAKVLQVDLEDETEKEKTNEVAIKSDSEQYGLFSRKFLRRHGLHLLGTSMTWFVFDIAFYSQNLFQKDIFSAVGWIPKAATMNALEELFKISRSQILIALCGTVPGYWFTVAFIDIIGRFWIQISGFFFMTAFMLGLAIPYHYWTIPGHHIGFVVLYGFTFFFANFGPNSTTFIVPAEIFPARVRARCHGISAAAGKAGAIVGSFGFLYAAQNQDKAKTDYGYRAGIGVRNSLFVLAACNLLGLLFTFLVPESKGRSLEEMSGENEELQEIECAEANRTLDPV
ncbi:hypothetical protein HPP92_002139 [Vanilla planifolia]|uniref:H(+)/Pi cotransporter n=1 Tax=Vanilla planifolia TaxID=51239 RepID=A0A835SE54_VANPL|nr:hypothetical protein HPP92_002430 [Vanilla planifolia]KAG0502067.1 hypothetical protein HPP92_002139 [Vanilla planifolia]